MWQTIATDQNASNKIAKLCALSYRLAVNASMVSICGLFTFYSWNIPKWCLFGQDNFKLVVLMQKVAQETFYFVFHHFSVFLGFLFGHFFCFTSDLLTQTKLYATDRGKWRPVDLNNHTLRSALFNRFLPDCVSFFGLKLSWHNGLINSRFKRLTKPN